MKKQPFQVVSMCMTADGVTHSNPKDAQEHAEDQAGRALQVLLAEVPGMGSQMLYRLTCHMLTKPEEFTKAFAILQAFDYDPENQS